MFTGYLRVITIFFSHIDSMHFWVACSERQFKSGYFFPSLKKT